MLEGHTDAVTAVAVSPDGHWIVSGSWDTTVRVWDMATGLQQSVLEGHAIGVKEGAVAVSADNQIIKSTDFWGVSICWSMLTWTKVDDDTTAVQNDTVSAMIKKTSSVSPLTDYGSAKVWDAEPTTATCRRLAPLGAPAQAALRRSYANVDGPLATTTTPQ
ncbi:hypothetical protein HK405_013408, partial [Cladochytrium tenue]